MYPREYINCAQEPIHICGEVQDYGYLLGSQGSKITFYSENILDFFSVDSDFLLGKDIRVLFAHFDIDVNWNNFSDNEILAIQHITFKNQEYTLSIHTHKGWTFFLF